VHWAIKWVGKSYPVNGCWLFLSDVYAAEFGVDLPTFEEYREPAKKGIRKIREEIDSGESWESCGPIEGAAVALTQRHVITHVGVYTELDGGKILHTINGKVAAVSPSWCRRNHWTATYYKCRKLPNI